MNDGDAALALHALGWILADEPRAERLLGMTGLSPEGLRAALGDRATLAAILGFLAAHEPDLVACAEALDIDAEALAAAARRPRRTGRTNAMTRPLVITDCDEVLMHMVVPFAQWVDEEHGVIFRMEDTSFAGALKRKECGTPLEAAEVWPLLDGFFRTEMPRQYPIPGALSAMAEIARHADIVVLTNVGPDHQAARMAQLAALGFDAPVIGSRGGKGEPVRALIEERRPPVAVFIDDLANHHHSVAIEAPDVWRLHMVGEPAIADKIPAARHAHVRIDDWAAAQDWILARLAEKAPAPAPQAV